MSNITLTRKIKLGIYIPSNINSEKERKEYKDFAYNIIRNVNNQNFYIHNLLVKKLIEIDSIIENNLNIDKNYIQIRNNYFLNKKDSNNKKIYFEYIKQYKENYIEIFYGKKNVASHIYQYMTEYLKSLSPESNYVNSYTYCAISKNVCKKYEEDYFDVNLGKKNIAFYKNNQPIPINIKAPITIEEDGSKCKSLGKFWFNKYDNDYTFKFKSVKNHNLELFLIFGKDKSNNRVMMDRIFDNDPNYKLCDSKIQIKDNEIYLLLSIKQFNIEPLKNLDPNKILGVDLGIKCAAYIATNNSFEHKQIGDKKFVLMKTKNAIEKNKRIIQKNSIFSKGGHGVKRKTEKLNDIRDYEKRFRNTFNHQVSSEIINYAIKWSCGQINVEDLSQIPLKEKNNKILRNWAYFDLLSKIEYKAKKNGILFNKVNPAYTSQTCSVCGEKGIRPKQDTFICVNSNCINHNIPVNADYNAAVNIAKKIK
jgi:IS605 OrfB family transposase